MIQEDYVSFEVAKLLEEKGFDEYCRAEWLEYIDGPSKGKTYLTECGSGLQHNSCSNTSLKKFNYDGQMYYAAPTLQMAMKWLREVHHIHIDIIIEGNGCCIEYKAHIRPFNIIYPTRNFDSIDTVVIGKYKTYEEAVETVLKYCLTNLI